VKCTLFGGGGFIGSAIADRLLRDGHELRIFERPRVEPYRAFAANEKVEWVTGDLLSMHDLGAAIDGSDAVVHLVSTTLPKSSNDDPIYDVQTNLVASLQMLEAMRARDVRRIVFISSGGTVYGTPQSVPIDERHPTEPQVSYGIVKLAIEKYLRMYQRLHGFQARILRVANPYGERQRVETAQGAVGVFLHRALHGEAIEVWGDGSVVRDYIAIDDVVAAFEHALVAPVLAPGPYNIATGTGWSINDIIAAVSQVSGRTPDVRYLAGRAYDVPAIVLDCARFRHATDWSPRTSLQDGIAALWRVAAERSAD
jgi:UDP-glucose 4-epimerase